MRFASYNVENLFDRAKVMNRDSWQQGRNLLAAFDELIRLLGQEGYSDDDKRRMARLMIQLGLEEEDRGPFVLLRRNRGRLLKRPRTGGIEIIADGRADWTGSLELRDEPIEEESMRNTARVMNDLAADIIAVVEAESRPVLSEFNRALLPAVNGRDGQPGRPFRHVMIIDGNDSRGIDVGLACRDGFPIGSIYSHVDDCDAGGDRIFRRDCPEYEVTTPLGNRLLVLVCHFKSKGYGALEESARIRRMEAARVAEIYGQRRREGIDNVIVAGDLNDTPDADPLAPLLRDTDLVDAFGQPGFDDGGHPGTYGLCNAANKIDYVLLSPSLQQAMTGGGVFRMGMWPGVRPRRWESYPTVARKEDAASDHAAIWVDLDV